MNKLSKILIIFIVCWTIVFVIMGNTASKDMLIGEKLVYSGIISLVLLVGCWANYGNKNKSKNSDNITQKSVGIKEDKMYVFEGEFGRKLLFRIEKNRIYNGMSSKFDYEIKDGKIYKALSSHMVYRIEGNRIYRGLDRKALYRIERNKIYEGDFGRVPIYRISSSVNG